MLRVRHGASHFRSIALDTKNRVVWQQTIYQGTVNSSAVRAAEVFKPAVSRSSPAIVVVHNHPSSAPRSA
jgi:DNA repair protein RadC